MTRIEELTSQVKALRKALKPFKEIADKFTEAEDHHVVPVQVGPCRRAKEALAQPQQEDAQ